ncbi:hypothetical protein KRX54_06425 [Actinomycetaceae bacterium TAE3-ERU4]|nr:hypothetical protein [Actinomycetaceae bacterium TAE3-ERU4]
MRKQNKVLFLAATVLSLGACSSSLPAVTFDDNANYPNVTQGQLEKILTSTTNVLSQAAQKNDTNLLSQRLSGSALEMRIAQQKVAKELKKTPPPINLSNEVATDSLSAKFPRSLVNVSQTTDGQIPTVSVFRQASALENYKLNQWARLFPGSTVPATPALQAGTQIIPDTATGYLRSPRDAVNAYVDFLTNREGKSKDLFNSDPFADYVTKNVSQLREKLSGGKDAVTTELKIEAGKEPLTSIETSADEALVFATLNYQITYRVKLEGTKIKAPGVVGVFLGENKETDGMLATHYVANVVLLVPKQDAKNKKITVLGAETLPISAEAKSWSQLPHNP